MALMIHGRILISSEPGFAVFTMRPSRSQRAKQLRKSLIAAIDSAQGDRLHLDVLVQYGVRLTVFT